MAELSVVLCYPTPDEVFWKHLHVPDGTTLRGALEQCGVAQQYPHLDIEQCKSGIYGKSRPLDTLLRDGDRIEIYRPLLADPKEARRLRAARKKK